jgi:hypothetical protein
LLRFVRGKGATTGALQRHVAANDAARLPLSHGWITRGATFFGCYARLRETSPDARLSCFALIRTMSGVEVDTLLDPVEGTITLDPLHRKPWAEPN